MRETTRVGATLLGLALVAMACGSRVPSTEAARPLRVALAPEMRTLDPNQQMHGGHVALCNAYEGLVGFDAQMRVVPALAERWESPDELTWRFHLRAGARFHDGRPVRAQDVVHSLEAARKPGVGGNELAILSELSAPADDVVELRTQRPYPMLLNSLVRGFVVARGAAAEQAPLGTGPYRVSAFDPRRGLELEAWSESGRPAPANGHVSFVFEADPERRLQLLERGEVDVALRLPETAQAPPLGGYRIVWAAAPGARVLALRADRTPFSDPRVRRAVSLAIDRRSVSARLLAGRARPLGQLLPQGIFGHVPGLQAPARDLAEARRLLAEASGGRGLEAVLAHGHSRAAEAELLARQLGEAGLRVALRPSDVASLKSTLATGEASMLLWSFVYYTGDATDLFETMLHGRDLARGYGADNLSGISNPEVDRLVELAGRSSDLAERSELFQEATRHALQDGPWIPLWEVPWVSGVRDGVSWTPTSLGWFVAADVRRDTREQPR